MTLREKLLSNGAQFRTKTVKLGEDEVLLIQPSVGRRNEIIKKATDLTISKTGQDMDIDLTKLAIYSIIECVRDPKDNKKIFEETDVKFLSETAEGTYIVDKLGEAVTELMNVEVDGKK